MMNLRDYLHKNRMKISTFAEKINYQRSYINDISNGAKKPGKKLALIIEKATDGEVTVDELLKEKEA